MALVIEDGTGVTGATSWISVTEADTILDARGLLEDWNSRITSLSDKEAKLREAVIYLDGNYTWKGIPRLTTQGLGWPRARVNTHQGLWLANDVVPQALKDAQAYLAWQAAYGPLEPPRSGAPIIRQRAGDVEREFASVGNTNVRLFPEVDSILRGLYTAGATASSTMVPVYRWN